MILFLVFLVAFSRELRFEKIFKFPEKEEEGVSELDTLILREVQMKPSRFGEGKC